MPVLRKTYHLIVILLVFILSGCSSLKTQDPYYTAAVVTSADLISGEALFGEQAKDIVLPDDDVLALNDTMRAYLKRYVPHNYVETMRVRVLARMIFGKGTLGMEYNASKTLTAMNAFKHTEGNCLAFSYLFTAFARERGLRASFQEVDIPPQWSAVGDELYYLSRHVNVILNMREVRDIVIDIDSINYKPHYRARKISDNYAIALYYSNKGTDYMIAEDFENAFRYLVKALELSPRDPAIWSNLGVMYRMKGMYNYAEKAYFVALKYKGRNKSVLTNLSALYEYMGEMEKSEYYSSLARDYQLKNPYYNYYQALDAFAEGDYDLTLRHLKMALKRQKKEHKFHKLLGETYAKLGDDTRANKALIKAQELLSSQ